MTDAEREPFLPLGVRGAIERCVATNKNLADEIDEVNPGDPWVSLAVRDDVYTVERWLADVDAKEKTP